jgi:hypothetical protein
VNQKGIAHIFLILIILVGIGVGLYLIQNPQIFTPKANVDPLAKITNEGFETTLNPFGNPWGWKKKPNPNMPVSIGGAGLKQYISKKADGSYLYQDSDGAIKEALAQYYAKTNTGYIYLDSYTPHSSGIDQRSIDVITRTKQLNPNVKFLGYYVQWEPPPGWEEIITKADAGDQYFEDFLVHQDNRPSRKEYRITARPDKPEWGPVPLLDITNPNVRAYVVPKLVASIQAAKMDGVMNDGLFYHAANAYDPNSSFPNNYMPPSIKNAWPGAMAQFVQDIKTGMAGTNLEIFGNVDDDFPQFMQNDLLRAGRLDGVIFEDPFNARPNTDGIAKVAGLMDFVDSVGKKAIYIVSGAHNGTNFASTNPSEEILAHRYFLAAYMLTMRNGNNMFEYHHPTSIFYQYNSQAFFKEWDLNLGGATSGIESVGNGVFVRKFEKGYVYWNPTNSNYTIQGGRDLYNIDNGQDINGQVVPAKSGAFFVTSSVLQEYNNPPAGTRPSPSPSAILGPAPVSCQAAGGICADASNKAADGRTCSQSLNLGPTGDCTGTHIYCFAANSCTNPTPLPSSMVNISTIPGSGTITPGAQTITWDKASGAVKFTLKIDDRANEFNQACDGNNLAGDICLTNYTSNTFEFNFIEGHTYTVQVFQHDSSRAQLGGPVSVGVIAQYTPPGAFTLNQPVAFCSGNNSHIRLSWTSPATNAPRPGVNSGYFIYIDGQYKYNALHALNLDDPEPKTPGQTYRYKVEAVVVPAKTPSNEQTIVAANCSLAAPNFNQKT